jgi:hypothetical protein
MQCIYMIFQVIMGLHGGFSSHGADSRKVYLCWMLGQGWQETVFRAGWNLE